jgi:predicted O-methyltransferase YrrM
LRGVQPAPANELLGRLGDADRFRASFEECRRELAPAYIDYIFSVSSALHAASLQLSAFLLTLCRAKKPASVADLGSGYSSHVLRVYAAAADQAVRVCSVDDSPAWIEKTRAFVERLGHSGNGLVTWDEFKQTSPNGFDLVLYDLGTMGTRGRELTTVLAEAKKGALIVLDDLHYRAYRELVEKVVSELHFVAYDFEELTRDEYGRFAWVVERLS